MQANGRKIPSSPFPFHLMAYVLEGLEDDKYDLSHLEKPQYSSLLPGTFSQDPVRSHTTLPRQPNM